MLGDIATLDLTGDVDENEGVGGGAFDCHLQLALEAGFGPSRLAAKLHDGHNPWSLLANDPGSSWRCSNNNGS